MEKLLFEYGGLMYELEHTIDIFKKRELVAKMNAINAVLKVPLIEYQSPLLRKFNNKLSQ